MTYDPPCLVHEDNPAVKARFQYIYENVGPETSDWRMLALNLWEDVPGETRDIQMFPIRFEHKTGGVWAVTEGLGGTYEPGSQFTPSSQRLPEILNVDPEWLSRRTP